MKLTRQKITIVLGLLLTAEVAMAAAQPIITSVFSRTSPEYKRARQSDGTFKREEYAIANGKYFPGVAPNQSIDSVKFPQIAGLVAQHLAKKNYHYAEKADSASFLLLITWGTTMVFTDPSQGDNLSGLSSAVAGSKDAAAEFNKANEAAMRVQGPATAASQARVREAQAAAFAANEALQSQLLQNQMNESARTKVNEDNARLIGYLDELNNRNDMSRYAGAGSSYDDLISDIESARYYIRITAYDFQKLRRENKQTVLWTTCVSIDSGRNRFDEAMAMMVAIAGQQFGQNNGLVRRAQDGTVSLDDLKIIGTAGDLPPQDGPDDKAKK